MVIGREQAWLQNTSAPHEDLFLMIKKISTFVDFSDLNDNNEIIATNWFDYELIIASFLSSSNIT